MVILKDLDRARRFGLISAKAQLTAGTADWATYFGLLTQATAVGTLLGLLTIWLGANTATARRKTLACRRCARVDRRREIPGGRGLVGGAATAELCRGAGVGGLIGLPGWWRTRPCRPRSGDRGLTILLVTPFAWAASAGRGYLSGIGALFLAFALAQILIVIGGGPPSFGAALFGGAAGPDAANRVPAASAGAADRGDGSSARRRGGVGQTKGRAAHKTAASAWRAGTPRPVRHPALIPHSPIKQGACKDGTEKATKTVGENRYPPGFDSVLTTRRRHPGQITIATRSEPRSLASSCRARKRRIRMVETGRPVDSLISA
ncbi:MAG: hypothetical protein U0232_10695 [Thermomicrobiales bacterium]